jgi:hypothetical protein
VEREKFMTIILVAGESMDWWKRLGATFGHGMGEVGMDEITVEKERRERTNGRKEEN